jgi:DNA polymerase III subunit delta
MLIFLYGQDTYRSKQKLKEIIGQYKKIHASGLNLRYLDADKFEEFKDSIRQTSIFKEKKLFVLSNVFASQDFKEKFLENSEEFLKTKDVILLYEDKDVLKTSKFFNFLKNRAKVQKFDFLQGEKLKNWIRQEFLKLKTTINSQAIGKLIDFAGSDTWLLSNEIKKLVNFQKNKKEEISSRDIERIVSPVIETAIFKTIDAISRKDKKRALLLIHQHLEKGDNPLYLISMIGFQFRNLLIVKDLIEKRKPYYLISKIAGLHPFVVKKSYEQASKFTLAELKKIYRKIFQADLNIKTGKISSETALDLLVAEI